MLSFRIYRSSLQDLSHPSHSVLLISRARARASLYITNIQHVQSRIYIMYIQISRSEFFAILINASHARALVWYLSCLCTRWNFSQHNWDAAVGTPRAKTRILDRILWTKYYSCRENFNGKCKYLYFFFFLFNSALAYDCHLVLKMRQECRLVFRPMRHTDQLSGSRSPLSPFLDLWTSNGWNMNAFNNYLAITRLRL